MDSRSSWSYDILDHVEDEVVFTKKTHHAMLAICAATVMGEGDPSKPESLRTDEPDLPPALWLMDTGCGHDLVNDKMAEDHRVKTLRKSSRVVFSTANGRVESRNVVPFYCKELAQLVHPTSCTTLLQFFRWESDAWSKDSRFIGKLGENRS